MDFLVFLYITGDETLIIIFCLLSTSFCMKQVFLILMVILVLVSCRKDPSWDIDIQMPVFSAELGINDFVADSMLTTDADSLLVLVIDKELYAVDADSLVDMPDSLLSYRYIIPFTMSLPPNSLFFTKTENKFYRMGGVEITDLYIRSGRLEVSALNYAHGNAYIHYSLDNATKDGNPLAIEGYLPSTLGAGNIPVVKSMDISGARINMKQTWHQCNTLVSTIKVYADPLASSNVPVVSGDSIILLVRFKDVIIDYARGNFGTQLINSTGISNFDEIGKLDISMLDLSEVRGTLGITNNLGSDVQFVVSSVTGMGIQNLDLTHPSVGKNINLPRATEISPGGGVSNAASYIFDLSQGNITEFIENAPSAISFSISGIVNPMGNVSAGNDFYYYNKNLNADLHLEIPLNLSFGNILMNDTINMNVVRDENHYVNNAILTITALNDFPLSASLKIYLYDENFNLLDSLCPSENIASAHVDANGRSIAAVETSLNIKSGSTTTDNLFRTKKAILKVRFSTGGNPGQKVKFFPWYRLRLKMHASFNYYIQS